MGGVIPLLSFGGIMEQFLTCFFDILFYPVNPEYLVFEENPLMLICCMTLIGIGIVDFVRRIVC